MPSVNIEGLDPIEVFRRLYNKAKCQGFGIFHYNKTDITYADAKIIYVKHLGDDGNYHFDYVNGRVMKVKINKEKIIDDWLYDRDNGIGSCNVVVEQYKHEVAK